MRVIALIAARNEARFIAHCLQHLLEQGLDVVLLDDGSTDRTRERAEPFCRGGRVDLQTLPARDEYRWEEILRRKESLGRDLNADWFLHADPDEVRLSGDPRRRLVEVLAEADAAGFNAVNFMEFTFVPTREHPDHDHPRYRETMRRYYPFQPRRPHRLTAWKKQPGPVELAWSGGHQVRFPGLRMYPVDLPMKHYLFLSVPHAVEKFTRRAYRAEEVARGWHGWRARLRPEEIALPAESALRSYVSDWEWDATAPRATHVLDPSAAPE
jgi:hypothetical protein